jgi:hypothetical protein
VPNPYSPQEFDCFLTDNLNAEQLISFGTQMNADGISRSVYLRLKKHFAY